ncbi:hypothetical protein EBH_0083040 [Eimeria brunetti]|uniref:Uncharacterized protein n=1 Tax=Eimeria brunetti TaxID=51314 RepID=U6LNF1_9EIME|nr:hypothetical protein EBH_0083040 [Eimeria brunetti]
MRVCVFMQVDNLDRLGGKQELRVYQCVHGALLPLDGNGRHSRRTVQWNRREWVAVADGFVEEVGAVDGVGDLEEGDCWDLSAAAPRGREDQLCVEADDRPMRTHGPAWHLCVMPGCLGIAGVDNLDRFGGSCTKAVYQAEPETLVFLPDGFVEEVGAVDGVGDLEEGDCWDLSAAAPSCREVQLSIEADDRDEYG